MFLKRFLPSCLWSSKRTIKLGPREKVSQIYDVPAIGEILINWCNLLTGLLVHVEIPLSNSSWTSPLKYSMQTTHCTADKHLDRILSFQIYPDEKNGRRRFRNEKGIIEFAWDFSSAEFVTLGDAQPKSGYYFSVILNGEMRLLLGDMKEEAYGLTKARKPGNDQTGSLISREDTVDLKDHHMYRAQVVLGDEEKVASVSISHGDNVAMKVRVGDIKVLDVKSIWKEIRGSKKIVLDEEIIEVSWNRLEWVPSKSKKKKKKSATKKVATHGIWPAVVIEFNYSRKDGQTKHSSYAVKLVGI